MLRMLNAHVMQDTNVIFYTNLIPAWEQHSLKKIDGTLKNEWQYHLAGTKTFCASGRGMALGIWTFPVLNVFP